MPFRFGQVAQLVEQRTENPCVGGSIPSLATSKYNNLQVPFFLILANVPDSVPDISRTCHFSRFSRFRGN
jgi:hypothetical protein